MVDGTGKVGDGTEQGTCDSNFVCHEDGSCKAAPKGFDFYCDEVEHLKYQI